MSLKGTFQTISHERAARVRAWPGSSAPDSGVAISDEHHEPFVSKVELNLQMERMTNQSFRVVLAPPAWFSIPISGAGFSSSGAPAISARSIPMKSGCCRIITVAIAPPLDHRREPTWACRHPQEYVPLDRTDETARLHGSEPLAG